MLHNGRLLARQWGILLANVFEVIGHPLVNLLESVRVYWQPPERFLQGVRGHWQPSKLFNKEYGKILEITNIYQRLPLPSDYLPEGIEHLLEQLPEGVGLTSRDIKRG